MQTKAILTLAAALSIVFAFPVVGAESVGASGQCYDDAGNGGQDAVNVDTDDPTNPTVLSGTGAAAAVVELGTAVVDVGAPTCTAHDCGAGTATACEEGEIERKDYLEVHAAGNQVCYDGTVRTDGGCPTSPGGPAA